MLLYLGLIFDGVKVSVCTGTGNRLKQVECTTGKPVLGGAD